jgi:hypothetical protein
VEKDFLDGYAKNIPVHRAHMTLHKLISKPSSGSGSTALFTKKLAAAVASNEEEPFSIGFSIDSSAAISVSIIISSANKNFYKCHDVIAKKNEIREEHKRSMQ